MAITRPTASFGGDFKYLCEQRVTRENGDAFAVDLVAGGAAAAKIIVVHRRQIIVYQRIGVNAFHGARERHRITNTATAGLGGGTGTGSAHVVARLAKSSEALTIAVVSYPFLSEGAVRRQNAEWGLERLREVCDTVIVLPNERLLEVEGVRDLPLDAAFRVADELLMRSISGVSEMIAKEGVVNLDFQDLRSVMENGGGVAMIGLGEATVEEGAEKATEEALLSPLLDIDISDARGALVNVVGGSGLTLGEAEQCAKIIREKINPYARMIWGVTTDSSMGNEIRVLLVLTGVKSEQIHGASLHTQMRNLRSRTVEFVS